MKNKFTLIEMIVAIVVLSILAAIVIANVSDMKKDSIKTAVQSNTKILQTAVDTYALQNNGELPVKGKVSLTNPQYVEVDTLYPKYIKSEVDYKKIKEQYYWIDVFGTVWGSTKDAPLNVVKAEDTMEWSIPQGVQGYNLYEVQDNKVVSLLRNQKVKKVNERILPDNKNVVQIPLENSNSIYLISTVDEYGLESAPTGLNYGGKGHFTPIYRGDGEYEFELSNLETMYWDRFWSLEDKPEGTSIIYKFSIKNEKGEYGEWVDDFYSLEPSKGLKIKITMKSFEGKNPSIYDLQVFYHYKGEPKLEYPNVSINPPAGGWTMDSWNPFPTVQVGGATGQSNEQTPSTGSTGGMVDSSIVCGNGGTQTNIDRFGKILDGGQEAYVTYSFVVPKGQYVNSVKIPGVNVEFDYYVRNMWFEYSKNQNPYVKANSMSEIPDESCVKVVYNLMQLDNFVFPPLLFPPSIVTTPEKPEIFVDLPMYWSVPGESSKPKGPVGGIPTQPEPTDIQVLDENWETVNTLRFFANSGDGQVTHWVSAVMNDVQPENTRILYRFATSNGYYWSNQVDAISKVSDSRSLMVVAYLQIHKDFANNPQQASPEVKSIRITHERGAIDLDMVKPTVVIMPVKDNNLGRDVISNASKINWQYETFDPRGLDIVETEWAGDKRETYPIGTYEVQLRVRNSSNYWSDWVTYKFEVKEEKPTADFVTEEKYVFINQSATFNAGKSVDPDGDGISKEEWRGNKKSTYTSKGVYTVELRVQDKEGNWSEWISKEIRVYDPKDAVWLVDEKAPMEIGLENGFDRDVNTSVSFGDRQITWIGDLRDKTIHIKAGLSTGYYSNIPSGIYFVDKDGNKVPFLNLTTGKYENEFIISGHYANLNIDTNLIMPVEAVKIVTYRGVVISEIEEVASSTTISPVTNVVVTPTDVSVKLDWVNPTESNFDKVLVYRNGTTLVGSSIDGTITDKPLMSDTSYQYTLVAVNKEGKINKTTVSAKTSKRAIQWSGLEAHAFDHDIKTGTAAGGKTVTWVGDLANKAVYIKGSFGTGRNNSTGLRVLDAQGNQLKFLNLSTNQYQDQFYLYGYYADLNVDTKIVMPEGASQIVFFGGATVYEVEEVNVATSIEPVSNIKANPTDVNMGLSWTNPSNLDRVLIFRDGTTLVGSSTIGSITDKPLMANTTYQYTLVSINKDGNAAFSEFEAKTDSRLIYWSGLEPAAFDKDLNTSVASSGKTVTWTGDLANKTVLIKASFATGRNNSTGLKILDAQGNQLDFFDITTNSTKNQYYLYGYYSNFSINNQIVIPENANRIVFFGSSTTFEIQEQ